MNSPKKSKAKRVIKTFSVILVITLIAAVILLRIFVTGENGLNDPTNENMASFLKGDSTICLLIHGFASGPQELKYLAEFLHSKGYSVKTVLLRGHNQKPSALVSVNWHDWDNQIKSELHELKTAGFNKYIVIGFSMGGLLALRAGLDEMVTGVVLINPCVFVFDKHFYNLPLEPLIKASSVFVPYLFRKSDLSFYYKNQKHKRIVYHEIPLMGVYQLMIMTDSTRAILQEFDRPILIIHADDDKTVDPFSSEYIFLSVKSSQKSQFILPSGGHLIVLNDRRDEVFEQTLSFIENLTNEKIGNEKVHR